MILIRPQAGRTHHLEERGWQKTNQQSSFPPLWRLVLRYVVWNLNYRNIPNTPYLAVSHFFYLTFDFKKMMSLGICLPCWCSLLISHQTLCSRTGVLTRLHLSFALSLWLLTLFSLLVGFLREPLAPAAVTRYLCIGSYASPFRGFPLLPSAAYWHLFKGSVLALKPLTLHRVINSQPVINCSGPDYHVLCFWAMSLLFFLCKFSASDIWQVPLCCIEFRVIISSDNLRQPSAFSS